MASQVNFTTDSRTNTSPSQLFHKTQEEGSEDSIILIPQPGKDTTKKENYI